MKNNIILVLFVLAAAGMLLSQNIEETDYSQYLSFDCRSFQPGEVLWVRFQDLPEINSVQIHFLGKTYHLARHSDEFVTPIGLDLGIQPGTHPIKGIVGKADGTGQRFSHTIQIEPKEFPVKKLWVEEKFVTPPPEVTERIQRESQLLSSIYSVFTEEWLGEGKFFIPCEGDIYPNFGQRRIFNNKPRSQHSGIDIASPQGMPVKASNSGQVVLASHLYFSGKTVMLDHGLGVLSIYCHFSEITVETGQEVEKGEIIGKIGSTGRVTGPHLHWSIKIRGSRVDPNSLLSLKFN